MKLPETTNALVLRTDFSDSGPWDAVCAAISEPVGDFRAYVDFVNDRAYEGLSPEQLVPAASDDYPHSFLFIVDRETMERADHPVLVVDLLTEPGRCFRVVPSEMWSVQNNLSLANMDFHEFADAIDADGVFHGFPDE
jgi:hypothetical protein